LEHLGDPTFMPKLNALQARWTGEGRLWQNNVIYRNAAHDKYHPTTKNSSGVAKSSPHMWGCAADLQTFPVKPNTAAT